LARSGHGQIVAAVAEAGTGKSRLVYEFKAMLPGDCKVLEAYSVSHGKASAYLPVLELLYQYFGIEEADDNAACRGRIESRLSALDPALSDTLPLLYTLMGLHEGADPLTQMDPQIKRRRMLDAIKRIILRESLNQPTVVIFEDLHWIDAETQALLDLLADGIAKGPRGEGSKGREQHIGAVKVARPLSQLRLPATVQGILASRIDRLEAEQKELLQMLAVMGRESPLGLIGKVASTGTHPWSGCCRPCRRASSFTSNLRQAMSNTPSSMC
jgi:predicted ATPase